eukprot:3888861-Karenia_brevis.AAC.1
MAPANTADVIYKGAQCSGICLGHTSGKCLSNFSIICLLYDGMQQYFSNCGALCTTSNDAIGWSCHPWVRLVAPYT